MEESGVDRALVKVAIEARKGAGRVLPFRFLTAARAAPSFEPALDVAMKDAIAEMPQMPGRTVVCVDTSGSMYQALSARSSVTRGDAAAALGSMINGDVRMIAFGSGAVEIPARRGMAGVDAVRSAQGIVGHGTNIPAAVELAETIGYDRLIVITDEQTVGRVLAPKGKGYMINVASARNGVGYGPWVHIDGFSENTLKFILELEGAEVSA
jgi:60 kDa SS-A/Ro ribonucleoprotein